MKDVKIYIYIFFWNSKNGTIYKNENVDFSILCDELRLSFDRN